MKTEKLVPPCSYQGGKQRLAKDIVDIIYNETASYMDDNTMFYDLCCGSGAIAIEMVNRGFFDANITMVDASPWGLFYKGVGDLTFSPDVFKMYIDDIPEDITLIKPYALDLLSRPADEGLYGNMIYKFLILQACSFGSTSTWVVDNRWQKSGGLRDYWKPTETSNRRSPVNPMAPMPKSLYSRVESLCANMDNITGVYGLVEDVHIEPNSIIYIDPPYKGTHHYGYNLDYLSYITHLLDTVPNVTIFLSEGAKINESDTSILLSGGRTKGNITGNAKKKPVEEWLNIFSNRCL